MHLQVQVAAGGGAGPSCVSLLECVDLVDQKPINEDLSPLRDDEDARVSNGRAPLAVRRVPLAAGHRRVPRQLRRRRRVQLRAQPTRVRHGRAGRPGLEGRARRDRGRHIRGVGHRRDQLAPGRHVVGLQVGRVAVSASSSTPPAARALRAPRRPLRVRSFGYRLRTRHVLSRGCPASSRSGGHSRSQIRACRVIFSCDVAPRESVVLADHDSRSWCFASRSSRATTSPF